MTYDISKYKMMPPRRCIFCGSETYWVSNNEPTCKPCIDKVKKVEAPNILYWETDMIPGRWSEETLMVTNTSEYALIVRDRDSIKALLLLYLVDLISISTKLPTVMVMSILRERLFDMPTQGGQDDSQSNN